MIVAVTTLQISDIAITGPVIDLFGLWTDAKKLCKIIKSGELILKLMAVASIFLLTSFFLLRTEATEKKTSSLCERTVIVGRVS